ncbi:hypothetical protein PC118_g18743 [Phytophthora cactorum]|uniref:BZIP domain-containing protein n=1 Tax=Phytophthora cactorum TaxID=29920 RepID=A0A8T1F830_9STRA|nr:hypothetical protein PC118_g18743 [Phytophthora cactorum]
MSDDVIGTVVQRTQPVRHPFYVNTGIGMHAGLGQQNYRDEPDKTPSSQIPLTRDKSSTTSRLLTMQEIHSIVDKDTLSELRAIMKDRRDRRKIIQQRHLKKKQKMAEDLVHSIPKLRNEIEQLQLRRLSLRERLPTENVWFTAIEYFRDFQYGLPVLATSQTLVSEFLSATMAPDLDIGARSARESQAIDKFLSRCHDKDERYSYQANASVLIPQIG